MVQGCFDLKGKTVAITRPVEQAQETGNLIRSFGGVPYFVPCIVIKKTCNLGLVKSFVSELQSNKIDYVLFMSVNGIRHLLSCADSLGLKTPLLNGLKNVVVMAVGPKTAQEISECGVSVDLVPAKFNSDGITACLQKRGIGANTIVIPRTKGATGELANSLRGLGAFVRELYVYESLLPVDSQLSQKFVDDLRAGSVDAVVFGSSLSAKNLFEMLKPIITEDELQNLLNSKLVVVAIGPVTAQTLCELGLRVDVMPEKYLFKEALGSLADYWKQ